MLYKLSQNTNRVTFLWVDIYNYCTTNECCVKIIITTGGNSYELLAMVNEWILKKKIRVLKTQNKKNSLCWI